MKKRHIYEILISVSVVLVVVFVIIRVGEILQESGEKGALTANNTTPAALQAQSSLDESGERILKLYGNTIHDYSKRYDIDWRLVFAVMHQESRFSVDAGSHRGAIGLMQIMPATFENIAEH